jgi:hypothetical protein
MDPKIYFAEAARIESEMLLQERSGKPLRRQTAKNPPSTKTAPAVSSSYSREQLPSGCVLFRMAIGGSR